MIDIGLYLAFFLIKLYSHNFLVNGKPQPLQDDQIKEIKSELTVCRDKINELMTRLDMLSEVAPSSRDESLPRDQEQRQQTNEPNRGKQYTCRLFSTFLTSVNIK